MQPKGAYSIWIIPEGETYTELKELISGLSKEYSAPMFEPHVTLVGEIKGYRSDVIELTRRLARKLNCFTIELDGLGFKDEFNRCLFFKTNMTEGYEDAIREATNCFRGNYNPKYMRHLSIIYGNLPAATKQKIIETIDKTKYSFTVSRLVLFSTDGEMKYWKRIEEFNLQ